MTFAATRLEHCLTSAAGWQPTGLSWIVRRQNWSGWNGCTPLGVGGPSLQLGTDTVAASDHVRILGVTISSDLSLDKHVSNVCAKCFFWLCQLRWVRRSLDVESVKTLVHAFVTTRIDYCNSVLAGAALLVHMQSVAVSAGQSRETALCTGTAAQTQITLIKSH